MKIFILLLFSYIMFVTAGRVRTMRLWSAYKQRFEKRYSSAEEEQNCLRVFKDNVRKIRQHNRAFDRKEVTYKLAINKFADLSENDRKKLISGLRIEKAPEGDFLSEAPVLRAVNDTSTNTTTTTTNTPTTDSIEFNACAADWPIRDQLDCGSCWAFSTIGSIEGVLRYKKGINVDLSEQQLTDCVYSTNGCNGGYMTTAFNYIKNALGAISETIYPYNGNFNPCTAKGKPRSIKLNSVTSYYKVQPNDAAIKQAIIDNGPITTAVDCSDFSFFIYDLGVYKDANKTYVPNHAVVLCGWGNDNGMPYWIVRNSWGANWGIGGYIYISAETPPNSTCTYGGLFKEHCFGPVF